MPKETYQLNGRTSSTVKHLNKSIKTQIAGIKKLKAEDPTHRGTQFDRMGASDTYTINGAAPTSDDAGANIKAAFGASAAANIGDVFDTAIASPTQGAVGRAATNVQLSKDNDYAFVNMSNTSATRDFSLDDDGNIIYTQTSNFRIFTQEDYDSNKAHVPTPKKYEDCFTIHDTVAFDKNGENPRIISTTITINPDAPQEAKDLVGDMLNKVAKSNGDLTLNHQVSGFWSTVAMGITLTFKAIGQGIVSGLSSVGRMFSSTPSEPLTAGTGKEFDSKTNPGAARERSLSDVSSVGIDEARNMGPTTRQEATAGVGAGAGAGAGAVTEPKGPRPTADSTSVQPGSEANQGMRLGGSGEE